MGKLMPGQKSSLFCASSLYTDMTYSKAATVRSTEGAAGLNTYAMTLVCSSGRRPALLAALLFTWIAYEVYS
jgi:hypothetical protein